MDVTPPEHFEVRVEQEDVSSEYDSIFKNDYLKRSRRGVNYSIPKDISETSDQSYNSIVKNMAQALYEETLSLSVKSGRKAFFYKFCFIIMNLYIILASAVVSILSIERKKDDNISYIAAVMSLTITTVGTFLSTFSFEKKASQLKQYSLELRELSKKIMLLQKSNISSSELNGKLEKYIGRVDNYSLLVFGSLFNTDELDGKKNNKNSSGDFVKDKI